MVTFPASCLPAAIVRLIAVSESDDELMTPADSSMITFSEQRNDHFH